MNKIIRKLLTYTFILVLTIAGFVGLIISFCGLESKCWWNPWIDTRCAPGFTEKGFDSIKLGMSKATIIELIGEPLGKNLVKPEYPHYKKASVEQWYYTSDGKCSWADWAWLGRYVCFDIKGKVTEKNKIIHYD